MPLRFDPPPDPLTETTSAISHVIESDALQRLTKEIERYGRRELAGRSILIAGHRGVGKTTLVRKAIENARGARSSYDGRPLFVDLHGPDLLAPPEKEAAGGAETGASDKSDKKVEGEAAKTSATPEKKPAADAGKDSASKQTSGSDLQSFVERLTFSLYRAAAKEFVKSYRELRSSGPGGRTYQEYSELAEQFALELDGSTDLGRIRLLYERAEAFEGGVLKTSASATGAQELALLAASSQAYRIISGKLDEDQSRETSGENKVNWSIAADNLLSPVTGLLTGALAWAALPAGFGPLAKLFTSLTAGVASAVAVKFTRTIQRESKQSSKVTFVPERNRLALRRLLPVLVDRFCDVGLPPIFVVDELDKVENISERMESLMGFLKQFVTERAFFCFLVDRGYYERLEATVSTNAFPKEATLFGDRLFVQYAPEAAHAYLKKIAKVGTLLPGESQDDAARDLEVLPYVLLRRSYMHPFDLRREISRSTNAKNEFRFPPRALFNVQQYRNEVYYQVAVECVLASEKLLDFAEDPNRAQLLYDALYYPIRTRKLPDEFDASREKLKEHLEGRMGKENGKLLTEEDVDTLHAALLELVDFLCTPRALLKFIQALAGAKYLPEPKVFPQAAVGVIEAAAGPEPTPAGAAAAAAGQGSAAASAPTEASESTPDAVPPSAPAAISEPAPPLAAASATTEASEASPDAAPPPAPPVPPSPAPAAGSLESDQSPPAVSAPTEASPDAAPPPPPAAISEPAPPLVGASATSGASESTPDTAPSPEPPVPPSPAPAAGSLDAGQRDPAVSAPTEASPDAARPPEPSPAPAAMSTPAPSLAPASSAATEASEASPDAASPLTAGSLEAGQSPPAASAATDASVSAPDAAPPPAPPGPPPSPPAAISKPAPLLAAGSHEGTYRWQFDKFGYPLIPKISPQAEVAGVKAATDAEMAGITAAIASLLSGFEDAVKLLRTQHGTVIDVELWERMRLIPTPPTWSYLQEAADALQNPTSVPATKVKEYSNSFIVYRANLESALGAIWSAVATAVTMTVHGKRSSPSLNERDSLERLAAVLADNPSRDQMLNQLSGIATDLNDDYPFRVDVLKNASYRVMLEAIQDSATRVRNRPAMSPSDVAQRSGAFYEKWFIEFYEGRQPKIDALWPFLSLMMRSLPLGLTRIDPLRMTIADWSDAMLQDQNLRQKAISLERLGFRRDAEGSVVTAGPAGDDPLLRALVQSIRKRGYEKWFVVLQPSEESLTKAWLPSENIACQLATPRTEVRTGAKYFLVELDGRAEVSVPTAVTPTRIAFFGPPTLSATPLGGPFVPGPESLDDLVERLDARPATDWGDPKAPVRPAS